MAKPIPQEVIPRSGDQGDRFTVTIKGDVLSGAMACDFGPGITVSKVKVVSDGELRAKIDIATDAPKGRRKIKVTNAANETGISTSVPFEVT